jgi:hypothetical protein
MKTLFTLFIFVLAGQAFAHNFTFTQKRFSVAYTRSAQKQTLRMKGAIIISEGESQKNLLRVLDEHVEQGLDTHIVLDVFGGDIAVVNKVYDVLRGKCHDRGYASCEITTEVEMFRYCASACVPLFMVGDVRRAAERSNWGFHQAALVEGFVMIPFMSEYVLRQKGVNAAWLKQKKSMFSTLEITWLQPLEMQGSGIMTEIVRHPR